MRLKQVYVDLLSQISQLKKSEEMLVPMKFDCRIQYNFMHFRQKQENESESVLRLGQFDCCSF
jgi:hypothetical protein